MNTQASKKITVVDFPIPFTVDFCETEMSYGNIGILQIKDKEEIAPKGILFNSIQDKHEKIKLINLDALDVHTIKYFAVEKIRLENPNLSSDEIFNLTTEYLISLMNLNPKNL